MKRMKSWFPEYKQLLYYPTWYNKRLKKFLQNDAFLSKPVLVCRAGEILCKMLQRISKVIILGECTPMLQWDTGRCQQNTKRTSNPLISSGAMRLFFVWLWILVKDHFLSWSLYFDRVDWSLSHGSCPNTFCMINRYVPPEYYVSWSYKWFVTYCQLE